MFSDQLAAAINVNTGRILLPSSYNFALGTKLGGFCFEVAEIRRNLPVERV